MFNEERFKELVKDKPALIIILGAGVASHKMTREMLDLDKYLMRELYKELMYCGAVEGVSSSCFKATKECRELILAHKEELLNGGSL